MKFTIVGFNSWSAEQAFRLRPCPEGPWDTREEAERELTHYVTYAREHGHDGRASWRVVPA